MKRVASSLFVGGLLGALASCSFTTAGNFVECKNDVDCGNATACARGYCLPLPPGCRREEAGGMKRAFEEANRIPLVALLPINAVTPGELDDSEVQSINAIKLAISEANDRLAKDRGLFGLFVCDTDSAIDGGGLERQGEWFITNLQAPALIVSSSGPTERMAQNEVRRDAGTFIISPNSTSPNLTTAFLRDGNVWRVPPPDTRQAAVMVDLLVRDFRDAGTRIDILHATGTYGDGFAYPLADQLSDAGFTTNRRSFVGADMTTWGGAVTSVNNDEPAATVLIGNTSYAVAMIERAKSFPKLTRAMGHRWYLTDSMKEQALITPVTITELDQSLGTAPSQGAGSAYATFRNSYTTRYTTDPNATNYLSHSYDATWLVMLAAQYAMGTPPVLSKVTGPRLGEGMAKLALSTGPATPLRADNWSDLALALGNGVATNVEGASGPLDFNLDAGAPAAPYEVWQVSDGGIRVLRQVNP